MEASYSTPGRFFLEFLTYQETDYPLGIAAHWRTIYPEGWS